jgi:hypothetical protein
MKQIPSLCLAAFCCLFLTGCWLGIKKPTITPDPPMPPIEESFVNVSVQLPLDPLVTELNQQIPPGDDGANAWDTSIGQLLGFQAGEEHLVQRDPIAVSMNGSQLQISTTAHYWVKVGLLIENGVFGIGGYSWHQVAQCGTDGDAPHDAILKIDSTVWLTNDYSLHSSSTAEPVDCQEPCLLTAANRDFTYLVRNLFQSKLNAAAGTIDSKLPTMFSAWTYASNAWSLLKDPIEVETNVWLSINPDKMVASPFNGSGSTVNATVGLLAYPQIIAGSKPPSSTNSLPDLGNESAGNNFHVALDAELTFKWASDQVSQALVGRQYPVEGHTFKITKASVYGTGTITVLQLGIGGDVSGTIYLVGKPSFDAVSDVFSVNGLDYSLETKNKLAEVADWLLHAGIQESLADQTKWDLSPQISSARAQLKSALNRNMGTSIQTSGDVVSLNVLGISSTPTSWKVRLVTDGTLNVNVSD